MSTPTKTQNDSNRTSCPGKGTLVLVLAIATGWLALIGQDFESHILDITWVAVISNIWTAVAALLVLIWMIRESWLAWNEWTGGVMVTIGVLVIGVGGVLRDLDHSSWVVSLIGILLFIGVLILLALRGHGARSELFIATGNKMNYLRTAFGEGPSRFIHQINKERKALLPTREPTGST